MNRLPTVTNYTAFSPAALIHHVKRRRPLGEVAAQFGLSSYTLLHALRTLRRDMNDFPVRRRKLRGVVYVEPISAPRLRSDMTEECEGCGCSVPREQFIRKPFGRWDVCAHCRGGETE